MRYGNEVRPNPYHAEKYENFEKIGKKCKNRAKIICQASMKLLNLLTECMLTRVFNAG